MICMAVDFYCKAIYALMCGLFFISSHTFLFEDEGSSVQSTLPSVEPLRGANLSRGMAHRALNSYSSHRALGSSPVSASPSVDGYSCEEWTHVGASEAMAHTEYSWKDVPEWQWLQTVTVNNHPEGRGIPRRNWASVPQVSWEVPPFSRCLIATDT